MGEIKFEYNDIELVLKEMALTSNSLKPSLPKDVVKNNELDVARKVEQINMLLEKIITNYKYLLVQNETMVKQSVEAIKATDNALKMSMSLDGPAEVKK